MKKALAGLRKLHLEDYWRRILGEILLAKRGQGEELLGGCGGSQPCLAPAPAGWGVLRRAVSEGALLDSLAGEEEVVVARAASLAPHHLAAEQEDAASMASLDHDTITSLRQFLTRAHDPSWAQNNLPGWGEEQKSRGEEQGSRGEVRGSRGEQGRSWVVVEEAPTRQVSRQGSFASTARCGSVRGLGGLR